MSKAFYFGILKEMASRLDMKIAKVFNTTVEETFILVGDEK